METVAEQQGTGLPLLAAYEARAEAYDEMVDPERRSRPGYEHVVAELLAMSPQRLAELRARADRMFLSEGVTFNVYGDSAGAERIFPFDPIPRVIDARTWAQLDLILCSSQFRRPAVGIKPPHGTFVTVAGIDLVRGADGRFYVLEDNVRTPSGVSYVIENRLVMTRLLPG